MTARFGRGGRRPLSLGGSGALGCECNASDSGDDE